MSMPKGVSDVLPLTPTQSGILFHTLESGQGTGAYTAVLTCKISGSLDPERFQTAFNKAVQRRDIYRAGFVWSGVKVPVQVIKDSVAVPFEVLDWQEKVDEARLLDLIHDEQYRPFDLSKPPLMRVKLIKRGGQEWQLVWIIHHLISDGWSTKIVFRDILALYDDPAQSLPAFASFKQYLAWLKRKPQNDNSYWSEHLEGVEEPSLLQPVNRSDGRTRHFHVTRHFGSDRLQDVETLSKQLKVTPHAVLSGIWALLLRRKLQSNDVTYGQPISGRPPELPGVANAAGAFLNTLPLRLQIDPTQAVADFLLANAQSQQAHSAHQFAGLADVQKCAPFPAGTKLFDTVFVNEGVQETRFQSASLDIRDLETVQTSNYGLTMLVTPKDQFKAEIYLDPQFGDPVDAEDWLDDYDRLLRGLISNPRATIEQLSWHEVAPITVPAAANFDSVLKRFLTNCQEKPNDLAVSDQAESLTYAELRLRALQIAKHLRESGVERDDLVPVALERGNTTVAAFLAVMMCGAAYVPIDLSYPADRVAQIFETVSPRHVLSNKPSAGSLQKASGAEVIFVEDISEAMDLCDISEGEVVYVIFTSGSQGRPKGVEITSAGLALSTGVRDEFYADTPDTFLLLSSFAFDSSVVGLYWTLATGGHLVIAPEGIEQQQDKLMDLVARHQVTHTLCLPSIVRAILASLRPEVTAPLKMIMSAGEAMPPELVTAFRKALPHCRLINEYGPTEATVWCAGHEVFASNETRGVPIGKAPSGMWAGVVDHDGVPVANGQQGEIAVTGSALAKGYLNDPEQTKSNFAHLGPSRVRSYKTGDLGRYDKGGNIVYLGRKDTQVKIRGHRVELAEIEAVSKAEVAGAECVAVIVGEKSDAIALFVETDPSDAIKEQIANRLELTLPRVFQPQFIKAMRKFPRLPNGKVDRKALIADAPNYSAAAKSSAFKDDLEAHILALFTDALGFEIGPTDNFFDQGGDSLKTIDVFIKGQEQGLLLQPSDIFDYPTARELADYLRSDTGRAYDSVENGVIQSANKDAEGVPIYIVHGSLPLFNQVARGLRGLNPSMLEFRRHLLGAAAPFGKTIEEMAADSVSRLKGEHPDGPYIICGYSAGCSVAMEMANQLGSERVAKLVLLDPPNDMLGSRPDLQSKETSGLKRKHIQARRWLRLKKFAKRIEKAKRNYEQNPRDEELQFTNVNIAIVDALARYDVPHYRGDTLIFHTDRNTSLSKGDVMDVHFPNKEMIHLDVTHEELVEHPSGIIPVSAKLISLAKSLSRQDNFGH